MLAELGHPEREYATVHVGGTNGKGSVSVLAYRALREAGYSVGLYTSPHLVEVRERMVVDDRPISAEAFAAWTERLRPAIDRTGASFFEATTVIAFADFAARGADLAVVEVGLGGRLDSTNVVDPLASVVTTIALEHTQYLGGTLEAIAREKAGIAKPGKPFVIGEPDFGVAAVLAAGARERGARPIVTVPANAAYQGPLALSGAHQRRNAAVAEALLAALPTPWRAEPGAVERGFAHARLAGRFDRRGRWIFDVAHNPAGVAVLIAALEETPPTRPLHTLLGVLSDKAWPEMVAALAAVSDRLWLCAPPSAPVERRWDLEEVARAVAPQGAGESRAARLPGGRRGGLSRSRSERLSPAPTSATARTAMVEPDFDRALHDVQQGAGTILVTGSFHTVGDALARLPGFAPLG